MIGKVLLSISVLFSSLLAACSDPAYDPRPGDILCLEEHQETRCTWAGPGTDAGSAMTAAGVRAIGEPTTGDSVYLQYTVPGSNGDRTIRVALVLPDGSAPLAAAHAINSLYMTTEGFVRPSAGCHDECGAFATCTGICSKCSANWPSTGRCLEGVAAAPDPAVESDDRSYSPGRF